MEENKELGKDCGAVAVKTSFKEKLDNFWYYYKWHSIVGLFVIIMVAVISLQMCTRESYDAYILYAGHHKIATTSQDGDSPHRAMRSTLKLICPDTDGDGSVNINLLNLYVLNNDEIKEHLGGDQGDAALIAKDTETLSDILIVGNYYVCFLSERIFLENDGIADGAMFEPLEKYATSDGIDYAYASERGIYLSSLPYGKLLGLPDDTVVCLRALNAYSTGLNKSENTENFAIGEDIIKNILNYR